MRAIVLWIVISFVAAAIGGAAGGGSAEFYTQLQRPPWAPPPAVFGPVWTALYLMMGLAAGLVAGTRPASPALQGARTRALALFVLQLGLNALWTWLFFAWRLGALAFVDIVLLIVLLVWVSIEFRRLRPPAAWLLLPYLAWVCFAAALNLALWQANPQVL